MTWLGVWVVRYVDVYGGRAYACGLTQLSAMRHLERKLV